MPKPSKKRSSSNRNVPSASRPRFVDLFAGCGGFSLGLIESGWKGVFAVEKDAMAFDTLRYNLVDGEGYLRGQEGGFEWPKELIKNHLDIQDVLAKHRKLLHKWRSQIDLVVGGPPCQGFSMAGRRKADDDRNELMHKYIEFIQFVKPNFLLIENVRGMAIDFGGKANALRPSDAKISPTSHAGRLISMLEESGYSVFSNIIRAVDLGIPQRRPRLIMIGIKKRLARSIERRHGIALADMLDADSDWFKAKCVGFLRRKGLRDKITVKDAIDDLSACSIAETKGAKRWRWKSHLIEHNKNMDFDSYSKGHFFQVDYEPPARKKLSAYVQVLRKNYKGIPNSMRLANHRPRTEENFRKMLKGRRGTVLSREERKILGVDAKKTAVVVLDSSGPSHTITTLPDDILHYSEPRVLTVRENARLQSFPDGFVFRGKYTTGSHLRGKECPRYTQVGNAVPPFLSEFLGELVLELRDLSHS